MLIRPYALADKPVTNRSEIAGETSRREMSDNIKIGVVTVSDRAARGEYEDRGGPAVHAYLSKVMKTPWEPVTVLVSDDPGELRIALETLADDEGCAWVITTGGTGIAPRDHTPDVTLEICDREVPGLGERMRYVSMEKVPTAMLSRQCAAIRGRCLFLNVPGSPKAIEECLSAVIAAIPHALELLGWGKVEAQKGFAIDHE